MTYAGAAMPLLRLTGRASCPVRDAPEFLRRFLLEHADGDHAVIALRPALRFTALPDLTLVRDCVVELRPGADGAAAGRTAVTWHVAGADDTVQFDGTLAIAKASDELSCSALLQGRFHPLPPVTVPAMERVIARRIAESVGRDLLRCVTHYLSASYRSAQSARLNRRTA